MKLSVYRLILLSAFLWVGVACELPYPPSLTEPYGISPRDGEQQVSRNKTFVWNTRFVVNDSSKEIIQYTFYCFTKAQMAAVDFQPTPYYLQPDPREHWIQLNENDLKPNTDYVWWVTAIGMKTDGETPLPEFNELKSSKPISFTTGEGTERDPRRFLVVIASSNYDLPLGSSVFHDLPSTYYDAKDMITAFSQLNEPYLIIKRYAEATQNSDKKVRITKQDFKDAFAELNSYRPAEQDLIVFYYSGHGGAYNGQSFFILGDTPQTEAVVGTGDQRTVRWDLLYNAAENVQGKWLRAQLDKFHSQKLVLADCCNSGQLIELNQIHIAPSKVSALSCGEETVPECSLALVSDLVDLVGEPEPPALSPLAVPAPAASVPATGSKYHVLTATTVDTNSYESRPLKNGLFTFAFLDGIGGSSNPVSIPFDYTYNADSLLPYCSVTFRELALYTRTQVHLLRTKRPRQTVLSYSEDPSFVFTNCFNSH